MLSLMATDLAFSCVFPGPEHHAVPGQRPSADLARRKPVKNPFSSTLLSSRQEVLHRAIQDSNRGSRRPSDAITCSSMAYRASQGTSPAKLPVESRAAAVQRAWAMSALECVREAYSFSAFTERCSSSVPWQWAAS